LKSIEAAQKAAAAHARLDFALFGYCWTPGSHQRDQQGLKWYPEAAVYGSMVELPPLSPIAWLVSIIAGVAIGIGLSHIHW